MILKYSMTLMHLMTELDKVEIKKIELFKRRGPNNAKVIDRRIEVENMWIKELTEVIEILKKFKYVSPNKD